MRKSKYRRLLDDPDVMRWFMNECRGSEITGRERLRRLGVICEWFDKTPKELSRMEPKQAKGFLMDMVTRMEKADMKANYIRNFVKASKSWLKYNENEINVKIKISKRNRVCVDAVGLVPLGEPEELHVLGVLFRNMAKTRATTTFLRLPYLVIWSV